jgi:hypothetical protein
MKFKNNDTKLNTLKKMAVNDKSTWALNYLTARGGRWISPAEIGEQYRRAHNTWSQSQSKSNHSAFGSPICKSLVNENPKVKRSVKGTYMYDATGSIGVQSQSQTPNVKQVTKASAPAPMVVSQTAIPEISTAKSTEDARLAYNAANGFIRVCVLPNGLELYKKRNAAGGWTYYGESGTVFTTLWDECNATRDEFLAIAKDCYNMGEELIVKSITSAGFKYQEGQLVWYFKDNLVHSARVLNRTIPVKTPVYETVHGTFDEAVVFPTKEALIRSL